MLLSCAAGLTLLLLGGCGGGGSSDTQPPASGAFADMHTETDPPGNRIDVSSMNLFPANAGDTLTYTRMDATGKTDGTVTRSFSATDGTTTGALTAYFLTEVDSTDAGDLDKSFYVTATQGTNFIVQLQDPLGLSAKFPGLNDLMPTINEYEAPFFAIGATRTFQAQGDLEADIDGDGRSDSFQFVYTQVFDGFETIPVLGTPTQVAHFTNTASFTLRGTAGGPDEVTSGKEDTYLAPNLGLVRRDTAASMENGTVSSPAYSIVLSGATVGGISYP